MPRKNVQAPDWPALSKGESRSMPKPSPSGRTSAFSPISTTGDGRLFPSPATAQIGAPAQPVPSGSVLREPTEIGATHFSTEGHSPSLTGFKRFVGALFVVSAVAVAPALFTSKTTMSARTLDAEAHERPPFRYTVSLAEVTTRAQTAAPLFGFGGVLHLRTALGMLGAELTSCARSQGPQWGAHRFGLRVDPASASFKVSSIPQNRDLQVQAELSCIRDRIESTELLPLRNLPPPTHPDYSIAAVITRSVVDIRSPLEPVPAP